MEHTDLMLVAYWIGGPCGCELVFCTDSYADRVEQLASQQGYEADDYTVTELFAKMYPGPKVEERYTLTAKGRELLEDKNG